MFPRDCGGRLDIPAATLCRRDLRPQLALAGVILAYEPTGICDAALLQGSFDL